MAKPTKEFLTAFLGKTLNIPADKVAALFSNAEGTEVNDTALDELLRSDADRVQKFKDENDTYFKNGQAKATKEILTDREKEIKTKYGITSDKKGNELIDEIIAAKSVKDTSLEEDKVKAHPVYIKMQDELTKKITETETTWKAKHEEFEKNVSREKTFANVKQKADEILATLKPILPKDASKAANQKRLLLDELNKFGYQDNNGNWVILDEKGKVLEDGHGNRRQFDTLVKEIAAKYWDFEEGSARNGSGADNDGKNNGAAQNKWKGKVPTTEAEYSKLIAEAKTAEDRMAITDAYEEATKTA